MKSVPGTINIEWYKGALQNGNAEEVEGWFQQVCNRTDLEICPAQESKNHPWEYYIWDGDKWMSQEDIDRYCALIGCGVRS